jgi:ribosomal protein S18 acetylase RimI-like enzyme
MACWAKRLTIRLESDKAARNAGNALVIEQAASRGVAVTLSVLEVNPRARQLYERLGFQVTAFDAPFFRMRRAA